MEVDYAMYFFGGMVPGYNVAREGYM